MTLSDVKPPQVYKVRLYTDLTGDERDKVLNHYLNRASDKDYCITEVEGDTANYRWKVTVKHDLGMEVH